MSRTIFVTAAGTELGKTFVACAVLKAMRAAGRPIDAFKPVLSGFDDAATSDAGRLLEALGRRLSDLDAIAPLRFSAPLAPPSAARAEGHRITLDQLTGLCRARMNRDLLIEGAGGVMSPIAEDATNLDLIAHLGAPALMVTGSYLGAISHTLTALEALKARAVNVAAIVVSQSEGEAPSLAEIEDGLSRFAPTVPRFVALRSQEFDAAPLAVALYGAA